VGLTAALPHLSVSGGGKGICPRLPMLMAATDIESHSEESSASLNAFKDDAQINSQKLMRWPC